MDSLGVTALTEGTEDTGFVGLYFKGFGQSLLVCPIFIILDSALAALPMCLFTSGSKERLSAMMGPMYCRRWLVRYRLVRMSISKNRFFYCLLHCW